MVRFCYGFQVNFTPENIIPISSLASHLDMSNFHCPNNLNDQALFLFQENVITGWNESVRSLKAVENQICPKLVTQFLYIDACMESIVNKAHLNPLLLGKPIKNPDEEKEHLSLTTLHLQFYKPILCRMIEHNIGSNYIATNLYQYAKTWVFVEPKETNDTSSSEGVCSNTRKAVIEAIESLLSHDRGILPCASLSEMLQHATVLEANVNCREGFEVRIGRQLYLATVNDLLILSQQCSKEGKYDIKCVKRILMQFYKNCYGSNQSGLDVVAKFVEDFLGQVANDIDLNKDSFISLAEMSIAASEGTERSTDGIYRAIDMYLNKHVYLKESECEEIFAVLNCNKMSPQALDEAARNMRLPVRSVLQVLYVEQLKLREMITTDVVVQSSKDGSESSKSLEDNEVTDEEGKINFEKINISI
ncbi:phototropic-responsive NPH3 family protein [Tanacetum coccineum]